MKLVIDRDKWARGKMPRVRLLLPDGPDGGCMCCLGFLALACGASAEQILDEAEPSDVPLIAWPDEIAPVRDEDEYEYESSDSAPATWYNSDLAHRLMAANDDEHIDEQQREREVAAMMLEAGIEVEFIGGAACES